MIEPTAQRNILSVTTNNVMYLNIIKVVYLYSTLVAFTKCQFTHNITF